MQGKSRSTTILMAYLIKYKKEDTNSSYKIIKAKRRLAMPNLGFMYKLREFEKIVNSWIFLLYNIKFKYLKISLILI